MSSYRPTNRGLGVDWSQEKAERDSKNEVCCKLTDTQQHSLPIKFSAQALCTQVLIDQPPLQNDLKGRSHHCVIIPVGRGKKREQILCPFLAGLA